MKKSLFVLILIGGWVIPSWAQNNNEFEQLCKKYQDSENVGSFGMDGLGCLLASWFIGKEANDINALIRQCSSFRILSCSGEESGNPVKYFIKMLLKQCPKRNIMGIFIQRR